jgi:hypothetical protein
VFYWGVDADSQEKSYRLLDIQANGEAKGELVVFFAPGTKEGSIESLTLSPDGQRLRFELWWAGRTGPVVFDLTRER